jgi:TPR repeat protein
VPDPGPDPSLQTADVSAETAPADAPRLSGVALARQFLSTGPRPEAIFERAEALEQAGDCPAAFALYSEAANVDPAMAARLARRYDPASHQAGPCIGASDIPYAIVYYTDAAESGDIQVQRRLGELMVNSEPSGPTREAGIGWLRTSAAAGDAEAARLLEGLGVTP